MGQITFKMKHGILGILNILRVPLTQVLTFFAEPPLASFVAIPTAVGRCSQMDIRQLGGPSEHLPSVKFTASDVEGFKQYV